MNKALPLMYNFSYLTGKYFFFPSSQFFDLMFQQKQPEHKHTNKHIARRILHTFFFNKSPQNWKKELKRKAIPGFSTPSTTCCIHQQQRTKAKNNQKSYYCSSIHFLYMLYLIKLVLVKLTGQLQKFHYPASSMEPARAFWLFGELRGSSCISRRDNALKATDFALSCSSSISICCCLHSSLQNGRSPLVCEKITSKLLVNEKEF